MNTIRKLFAVAALVGVMPAAFAASTVDLTVSGTIVPASCTPTLSAPNVNFGKFSSADLNTDESTKWGDGLNSSLTVNCVAPTLYGIRSIDNRSATVGHNGYMSPYGLGLTSAGEKLGAHYLEIKTFGSTIDGKRSYITVGNSGGTTWAASLEGVKAIRNTGELLGFTDQIGETTGPIAIKDGIFALAHYVHIAPASGLTLTSDVALDGSATIEVVYL